MSVLDNNIIDKTDDAYEVIRLRIKSINNQTNMKALLAPFKELKIDLVDSDIELMKLRNLSLHGNIIPIT